MKKNYRLISLVSLIPLLLTSCGQNKGYSYNKNVTNENGSASYEIFVRSFYDHDGDGVGDFLGIKDKMSYLSDLGVKTLWLLPIHKSPTYHGYDVDDYYSVCPEYGTLADFDAMVEEANKHNIDIMIDMVLNHTSTNNQWFRDSYQDFITNNTSPTSKQYWYNWRDTASSGYSKMSNNAYYEAQFNSSMPDLNYDCQAVKDEIDNIFKFWIQDHGVKGFRLDAVKYYYYGNTEKNVQILDYLMDTARKYDENFYMVGEDWENDSLTLNYHKSKVQSFFRFSFTSIFINTSKGYGKADDYVKEMLRYNNSLKENNANGYASYFLSNHDQNRPTFSKVEQAKLAASLLLLTPGTPWIYYGEEIQMKGYRNSESEGSDVKRRLPMVWSKDDKTGECAFPEKSRKDLDTTEQVEEGVDDALKQPRSLVNHYKKVINARNAFPFVKDADVISLLDECGDESNKVIAYELKKGNDYVKIYTNLTDEDKVVTTTGKIVDQIDTMGKKSKLSGTSLTIAPYSTVLVQ